MTAMTAANAPGATRAPAPAPASSAVARWAGAGYLAIFALAIYANFAVRNRLVVADDPMATMTAIAGDASTFRLGIAAFTTITVIDIGIAWALHQVLRPSGEQRSLLAAWLRLGYSVIFGAAVTFMAVALHLATGGDAVAGLGDEARAAMTGTAMEAFDVAWLIGLVVFGLHLIAVGRILVDARLAPRALGWALAVAGTAYIADTLTHVLLADYASVADLMLVIVMIPSMVAEMWLTVWLLAGARRATVEASRAEPEAVPA
ncbi:DUF4386 domain-containing protein [Demequina subtropica]|uniref:DUF4386 domain-containing protein n=1 Tax=Demequina subtropica TaxID=1638989 RepID=UPI0007831469|nr:DUF4386 domain-containing protein [Demequina subtropica]